jgi:hypothetical protein
MKIKEITKIVSGCFGLEDWFFANHPLEKERAVNLKKMVTSGEVNNAEIKIIAAGLLALRGCSKKHIDREMNKWDDFFKCRDLFPSNSLKNSGKGMDKTHQRIGSQSNAHVGRDFEKLAY